MPSNPPPLDDDDLDGSFDRRTNRASNRATDPGAHPEIDGTVADTDEHSGGSESRTPRRYDRPNFWIRRIVVVGGVVAVFAAAALIVSQLIDSTSTDVTSGAIDVDWDRIVLIDDRTGRVVIDNDAGEEIARIETRVRAVVDSRVVAGTAVIASADQSAIVDLDDESTTTIDLADGGITQPSGSALTTILETPSADRGVLVHGTSGDIIDTDSFAPISGTRFEWNAARSDPSGRHLLVTDSGNFQSVLFSFDRDEPSYVPGLALAVDERIAVTAQNIGTEATVSVFDHDGELISSGTASSVRAAMITGDSIQLVTVDGDIVTMQTASGDTDASDQLEIGQISSGDVSSNGDQLILTGADGTAIIDADGRIVGTYPELRPLNTTWAVDGSTCVSLGGTSTTPADGSSLTIVDLADGSIANEADGLDPRFASADGCTVAAAVTEGYQLVSRESVATFTTSGDLVGLAPDASVVLLELDRRLVVTEPGADEPTDLGPVGRTAAFT